MTTPLLEKPKKLNLKVATNLIPDNYYYIYEISDSLKSTDEAFKEINDSSKFCHGKFDSFDRRNNKFNDVKCPNEEYKEKSFSIINNLFLEECETECCKILDGNSMKSRTMKKRKRSVKSRAMKKRKRSVKSRAMKKRKQKRSMKSRTMKKRKQKRSMKSRTMKK